MYFIKFRLLLFCVIVVSAKTSGIPKVFTRNQLVQESSTPYVVIPPTTSIQDINMNDRVLDYFEAVRDTSSGSFPAVSWSYTTSDYTSSTASYPSRAKHARLFGLEPEDKDKLQVELAFVLPFLDVPLGKKRSLGAQSMVTESTDDDSTMKSSKGTDSVLALNPKSIVHGVVLSLAAVTLIPFLMSLLTGTTSVSVERSEDSLYRVLSQVDHKLQSFNIDASSCMSKAICTYVKLATKKMGNGRAGSSEQIIDGIIRNSYVKSLIDGTSIAKAIEIGRKPGATCIAAYPKCPFTANAMSSFLTTFISQMVETPP